MGYVLYGVVGRSAPVSHVAGDLDLPTVGLAQDFSLALWTPEDFDRLGVSDRESEPAGFLYSHSRLLHVVAERSGRMGLAYVEAEFFGGTGEQGALVYRDGRLEWLSEFATIGRAVSVTPISDALQRLGARRHKFSDEFDALGLSRHRDLDGWLDELDK